MCVSAPSLELSHSGGVSDDDDVTTARERESEEDGEGAGRVCVSVSKLKGGIARQ